MYENKKIAVIIAAAGKGTRVGGPVPKQFLKIGGDPVILKTLKAFNALDEVDHIFIVTNEEYIEHCAKIVADNGIEKVREIVKGGAERQESVYNALQEVNRICPGVSYVLIHDAARPFVSEQVVRNVIKATAEKGAAVACVAMKDSLRRMNGEASQGVNRSEYCSVQTPQGFRKADLMEAHDKALREGLQATDDAMLVELAGFPVEVVDGDYQNIKITTREDLPVEYRTGIGYDVHALTEGRKLILVHALMDALLGAAALGDIGQHFPDTDDTYKGISSMVLLEKVRDLLAENFFSIANVDMTIMAQRPRIGPHIEAMRDNIAEVLGIGTSRVNVKATTTERLGFVGREEGLAAEAICSIYR